MGARRAVRTEDAFLQLEQISSAQGGHSPEDFVRAVHTLLDHASPTRAQRAAGEGLARFPDHPELQRLHRLLTLPAARSIPSSGRKKNREGA